MNLFNASIAAIILLVSTSAISQEDACSKKYEYRNSRLPHQADATWLACGEPEIRMLSDHRNAVGKHDPKYGDVDLTWRRCSEGQTWSAGACKGKALLFTHEQAIARAEHEGWRLPSIGELRKLYSGGMKDSPAIDLAAFPNTPAFIFWASDILGAGTYAHGYDFRDGGVMVSTIRSKRFHVRLVKTQ